MSVVIPAYNGAEYLSAAVQSVVAQTVPVHEIIVVDDGSTDETASVAASLPVDYVHQPNKGPAGAMNTGVSHASGDHLAFLSSDDLWVPDKVAIQLAALRERPDLDAVFGHVQHFVTPGLEPDLAQRLRCPPDPVPASSAGTMLISTGRFQQVGPFDEEFRVGEFFDWYARATDLGLKMAILTPVVSRRRVHERNHSRISEAPTAGYMDVLRRIRQRRRADGDD